MSFLMFCMSRDARCVFDRILLLSVIFFLQNLYLNVCGVVFPPSPPPSIAIAKAELSNLAHTAIRVSMELLNMLKLCALSNILFQYVYKKILLAHDGHTF